MRTNKNGVNKDQKDKVKKDGYNRGQHCVYCLTYHMIFVTHYRKPVINDEMSAAMKEFSNHMAEQFRGKVLSAETEIISTCWYHCHRIPTYPSLSEASRLSYPERCASVFRNRLNSISMGTIPHSGAAATLSQLPEVFLLKQ